MPTVKLHSNGKVILKDGKVSCSCCGPCCMYPADMLDAVGGYTAADLPDAVTIDPAYGGPAGTYNKVGSAYEKDDGFATIYSYEVSAGQWKYGVRPAWFGEITIGDCLQGVYADGFGGVEVEDQFAATYSVGGDTVTRQSLCVWSGAKTGGGTWTLRYNGSTTKWNLNGTEKTSGNQSTPTGTYSAGTVS